MPDLTSNSNPKKTRPKSGCSLAEYEFLKRKLDELEAAGVIAGKRHDACQAEMAKSNKRWDARIEKLRKKYPSWLPDDHKSRLFHMYARRKIQAQEKIVAKHFPPRPRNPAAAQAAQVNPPPSGPKAPGKDNMSLEARAVAVLTENPTWTQEHIAETICCTRQSLYNMQEYQRVREVLRASRQTRKKTGTLGKIGSHNDIEDDNNDGD